MSDASRIAEWEANTCPCCRAHPKMNCVCWSSTMTNNITGETTNDFCYPSKHAAQNRETLISRSGEGGIDA